MYVGFRPVCMLAIMSLLCASAAPMNDPIANDKDHWTDVQDGCRMGASYAKSSELGAAFDIDLYMQNVNGPRAKITEDKMKDFSFAKIHLTRSGEKSVHQIWESASDLVSEVQVSTITPGNQFHGQVRLNNVFDLTREGEYTMSVSCDVICEDRKISLHLEKQTFRITTPSVKSENVEPIVNKAGN